MSRTFDRLRLRLESPFLRAGGESIPIRYTDAEWKIVRACFTLLRRAAAELRVVFAEAAAADFTEVAQIALSVLKGEDEFPIDAAQAVADGIRHLLVDEFQDTSRRQHELLRRLIAAWSDREGRTCFVVGDPMQSIYGFREADAELFPRVENSASEVSAIFLSSSIPSISLPTSAASPRSSRASTKPSLRSSPPQAAAASSSPRRSLLAFPCGLIRPSTRRHAHSAHAASTARSFRTRPATQIRIVRRKSPNSARPRTKNKSMKSSRSSALICRAFERCQRREAKVSCRRACPGAQIACTHRRCFAPGLHPLSRRRS